MKRPLEAIQQFKGGCSNVNLKKVKKMKNLKYIKMVKKVKRVKKAMMMKKKW
jgi:hypothetical protein